MVYRYTNARHQDYYLHGKQVELRNHRIQQIYYFAKQPRAGALDEVPKGYEVVESKRTGLPVLKRIRPGVAA